MSVWFYKFLRVIFVSWLWILHLTVAYNACVDWSVQFACSCWIYAAGERCIYAWFSVNYGRSTAMSTYTTSDLWTPRHAKPPTGAVRRVTARCYASAVLAMALCLRVRPFVTSRCSIETDGRIELAFATWASSHPSYTVLKGNSVISKNNGTSLWNFVLNSGLGKFRQDISIVETCYQLSSRKVDAESVIN